MARARLRLPQAIRKPNLRHLFQSAFLSFWLVPLPGPAGSAQPEIPPAFGPYVNLTSADFKDSRTFAREERIVGTYYFYWYDAASRFHVLNPDGSDALTDHPPSLEDFSWKSVTWHKRELADMIDAGIDVVLPVFWGAPSEQGSKARLHWSYAGLPPLVQAREELLREGRRPPLIGLFYDTSTLRHNAWRLHLDLTTDYGKEWFYATIRDFFSLIPPRHWAMIDGRPIVLLYSAAFALNHDQGVIDHTRTRFAREFAGRIPYLVREVSWRVTADNTVAWGGALGLKNPGVASVGPGYDHSAVPGRTPLIVPRESGKFYEQNWLRFLRRPSSFVLVETWNEFHEGTTVCETREYGRQYIELTRRFADLFKSGWRPPWPPGSYADAASVSILLGSDNQEKGLSQLENEDGLTVPVIRGERQARAIKSAEHRGRYIYFRVDDSFKWAERMDLELEVEYYDAAAGRLGVEFDGSDTTAPFAGAYTRAPRTVSLTGSGTWQKAVLALPNARFLNGQNRGADLRLTIEAPDFALSRVTLTRR